MKRTIWLLIAVISLLIVGCKSAGSTATSPTPLSVPAISPIAEPTNGTTFTIVYDNVAPDDSVSDLALRTSWGFGMMIETEEATVLFDTGEDADILLDNMAKLGFDPLDIDVVVISHLHGDHIGGLRGLLDTGAKPVVYSLAPLIEDMHAITEMVEVTDPMEILPGIYTTGELGSSIREQALVVETEKGLVVVTGCAHPGIVEIVRRVKEIVNDDVTLVMGGFHLGDASEKQIEDIIADFRELGVQQIAPSHCTGDQARNMFADEFGDNCILPGVGQQFIQ